MADQRPRWRDGPVGYDHLYQKLDPSRKEIRILNNDISTASAHGMISYQLETTSLADDSVPYFEAISYCWGDSTSLRDILVGNKIMSVPESTEKTL